MNHSIHSKACYFYEKHSWKFGVLILAVLFISFFIQKIKFNADSIEAYGKIYEIKRIVSGGKVGPQFKYKFWFTYKDKKYYGETTNLDGNNKIGRIYKVKFLPNQPKKHEILCNQEYIEKHILDEDGNKKIFYLKKN